MNINIFENTSVQRAATLTTGLVLAMIAACAPLEGEANLEELNSEASTLLSATAVPSVGSVFVMTNGLDANEVVMFDRSSDGLLTRIGAFATGGRGVGDTTEPEDALGSQGSLVLSSDGRWLLAVNAGSDEISVFQVNSGSLTLADKVPSGGSFPASLALHDDLLYVLNSGGDGNITGFRLSEAGRLRPLRGSTRSLAAGGDNPPFFLVSPGQVGFTPDGSMLVVTQKGTNEIHIYPLDSNDLPAPRFTHMSNGTTPFGFAFSRFGRLLVAEAFGSAAVGTPGAGAVSSYTIRSNGASLPLGQPDSGSVGNSQTATCWLATSPGNNFAYTTNNGSSTVSGYRTRSGGAVQLLGNGVSGHTGRAPVDLAVVPEGDFLYTLNAGDGTISMFNIARQTGDLTHLGDIGGLPAEDGIAGIAAR